MILYLIGQLCLILFNYWNVYLDAARINKHKHIYHGINFGAYTLFVGALCWAAHWNIGVITLFGISAFCNRQFSFDIPLNLRRGLKWDYVTKADPPASILDRIEIRLFGRNGRAPFVMYGVIWLACLIIKFFV